MKKKIVLAFSGGLDSAVALFSLFEEGYEVHPVFFTYGSKQNEIEMDRALSLIHFLSGKADIQMTLINLEAPFSQFKSNLLQGQGEVPASHYRSKEMDLNFVPARNIIFASILTGIALTREAEYIALGAHRVANGGSAIYPDSRKEFMKALDTCLFLGTDKKVSVYNPLENLEKFEVVKLGDELGVPFHLTYTCYRGGDKPCGVCGSCTERQEAFLKAGVIDTIEYQTLEGKL